MSIVKSKKLQVGTDATASNNFTIYQPSTPDGTLRIGQGTADNPTEVGQFNANGYKALKPRTFRARQSASQSFSTNTWTKMQMNTEDWDTDSEYDTSIYRYTPTVAGYYRFSISSLMSSTSRILISVYKNGSEVITGVGHASTAGGGLSTNVSGLVYMNGSTDYVEPYFYQDSGSTVSNSNSTSLTWFDGILMAQA